jgi:ABC-type multidrug transport system ATPase subunit
MKARLSAALTARAAAGVALVVVTHDLSFAAETFDRALVLDRGRLEADETLAELLVATGRLAPLGLAPPPVAALSTALRLPGAPVRVADAARALARVAGGISPV